MRITHTMITDPDVVAFRKRARIRVQPALMLMTSEGEILHRQYAGLYPAYAAQGSELPGWSESLLELPDLLDLIGRVEARRIAEEATIRALRERGDTAATVALARMQVARGWPQRACALLARSLNSAEDPSVRELLAESRAEMGSIREARKEYEELLRRHPAADDRERWRYERARLLLVDATAGAASDDTVRASVAEALANLRELAESVEDPALEIQVHLALALGYRFSGDEAALGRELDWLAPRTGPGETSLPSWTARALLQLMELELGDDAESVRRAERHGWQLVHTFPDSPEAQVAKHGMLGGTLQIARPG